jgi:poly-beta-1,6-N-acetyl-D-glucosamine synthase
MTRNDRPPPTRRGVHELRYVRHQPAGRTALGQLAFNDAKTMPYLAQMAAERRKIVALIPAHNEEDAIRDTITSLNDQDLLPDRIIIVADNCSDDTELIACAAGVEVMATRDNPWKKAGALNQALDRILPELKDRDLVLIQDADTNLNPGFLSSAVAAMTDDAGGVCAQYDSPPPRNILECLQSSEFARSRRRTRLQGAGRFWSARPETTKILVGIAALFRVGVLREVAAARAAGRIPGTRDRTVYSSTSVCEDYELTLALRSLGYRLLCPAGCRPKTDAMPTVTKLWHQRVRWTRGGLDDLYVYGVSPVTRGYVAAHAWRMVAMLSPFLYASYLLALYLTFGHIAWSGPWLLINVLFIAERVITVREEGWRAMAVSALLIPELAYDWFMSAAYLSGLAGHLRGSAPQWRET